MFLFAVTIILQLIAVGLIVWFFCRRKDLEILTALTALGNLEQETSLDSARVCDLLATAGKALSNHSEQLCQFERSLSTAEAGQSGASTLGGIQQANQSVEHTIDTTIAGLMSACDDLMTKEQSSLEAYRKRSSALGSKLDGIKHIELLVQFAGTLLGMVRELRTENKVVRDEVDAGKEKIIQLATQTSSVEQIARIEAVTRLSNREAFDEAYARCEELRHQNGQPYSLVLLDIDDFKSVNDEYGHAAGDGVLSLLARILLENSKPSDHACRLGGGDFGVLLTRCDERAARSAAECYRYRIESTVLHHHDHEISVTVSCGVAQGTPGTSQSDLLERAGAALYAAKKRGRNQTCGDGDLNEEQQKLVSVK
ncbi:MAG TPA: GGDEF domain-containing protein [Pirellulaceae bacterium]|jgi:diguanylate cyclase|nr:GGDEF domain-containing protein [Pirellulaceae bacterium]